MTATMTETAPIVPILIGGKWSKPHTAEFGNVYNPSTGDVIGRVGATGRATGYHLHYEVLANGRLLNPLQLLTQQRPRDQ